GGAGRRLVCLRVDDGHVAYRLGRGRSGEQCHEQEHGRISFRARLTTFRLNGEAFSTAARAFGVRVVEHETGGEIVFAPIHDRSDQVQDGGAVDVESAARSLDLLVERLF